MYFLIYKTTHINGRFYIGRHQTNSKRDGYLGSGKWVTGIKDKSNLTVEILEETNSLEELCLLEELYISLNFDNPLCMNISKSSNGISGDISRNIQLKRVADGTHPFLGSEVAIERNQCRVDAGTHNFLGGEITHKRLKEGTHNFLDRKAARDRNLKRVATGSHHFQQSWKCPHCSKEGIGLGNYSRYHGDNCSKIVRNPSE